MKRAAELERSLEAAIIRLVTDGGSVPVDEVRRELVATGFSDGGARSAIAKLWDEGRLNFGTDKRLRIPAPAGEVAEGMNWKDTSRRDRNGAVQSESWELRTARHRLTVHRLHGVPDLWFCSCVGDLSADRRQLRAVDAADARREALELIRELARAAVADLEA